MGAGEVNPYGGSGEKEDRDTLCTPRWLAKLIGKVDLDPCSNDRSHIISLLRVRLELGGDGLEGPAGYWRGHAGDIHRVLADDLVFINPPYARGQVIRWVRHYRHTRFIYLLRWSPDTEWFAELYPYCTHLWFPKKTEDNPSGRINFEPPPGVKMSSNPFPHALYLRKPSLELLERLDDNGYLITLKRDIVMDAKRLARS